MAANEYGFALYNRRMSALTRIYGRFIEGFDTLELKQVKVLGALAARGRRMIRRLPELADFVVKADADFVAKADYEKGSGGEPGFLRFLREPASSFTSRTILRVLLFGQHNGLSGQAHRNGGEVAPYHYRRRRALRLSASFPPDPCRNRRT
jgi:hypothetical protein